MSYYLLAESADQILKEVYSGQYQQPQIDYLFDQTDMASLKETSPVLVHDKTATEATLKNSLEQHSGLLIQSNHPKQQLLAHLRQILFVYFRPEQIALFRYYDPYITSYFFSSLSEQETASWLGPIEKIQWFNTDWRNKVSQPDQWQQKLNPYSKDWLVNLDKLKTKPILSGNQLLALEDMQQEKYAYNWQQDTQLNLTNIDIDRVISWVKQGIKDDFIKKQSLNQYLSIRAEYPNVQAPESWPSGLIEERIIYLEYYLKKAII